MKKSLAALLLIFAFTSIAFCQINGQQPLITIESLPVLDTLPKETPAAAKGASASFKESDSEKAQGVNRQEDEPSGRVWVSAEYLLWRTRGSNLPPLITVTPASTGFSAVIGQPGTVIAFGGERLDQGNFPGGRLSLGFWLNKGKTVGAEVSYFFLEKNTLRFQVASNGSPDSQTIGRPFLSVGNTEQAISVVYPIIGFNSNPPFTISGTSTATFFNRLQGAEGNLLFRLSAIDCCRLALLTGFRYLDLREGLTITDISQDSRGTRYYTDTDQFNTNNRFYGGEAGLRSTFSRGRFGLELSGTVALGSNRQSVDINGETTDTLNIGSNGPGGILALVTNIGSYSRSKFAVVPEFKAKVSYDITRNLKPFVGYDFLYWNQTVRPGEQIDRVVNVALRPPPLSTLLPARPAFTFNSSRFWTHGLTTGVTLQF
ncbi:MAG: BBP7 family outer membrane beta-barrel protein [Pyrinomonadaceae bacterium]|nr:BBP7 family outer membrane beta-barrel protein [Pyrinomonadaceae bacterium]